MKLFKYVIVLSIVSILSTSNAIAQTDIINVGIRMQKASGLYWENGFDFEYSNKNILSDNLFFGFSYISSRLGTAFNSNAIKQDNFIFSARYYIRKDKSFRPFSKFNLGYFHADYGSEIFDSLDNTSLTAALELGLSYAMISKLKLSSSFGYNFISGNGIEGPGTLYPIFLQSTISWKL
jgi:hypothetical protein